MSAPVIPQLNNSGVNRNIVVEVKISGVYTPVGGVKNFDPTTDDANLEAENRYSDGGYNRSNKTGTGWSATMVTANASLTTDGTSYDPAQEYLRALGEGQLGQAAIADIRWYEFDPATGTPRSIAKQGTATVSYKGPGGDANGNQERTYTFTGQGKLNNIAHPYPNAASVPTISAVTPSTGTTFAAAGGTGFRIIGSRFTGVTAVTFGGTAATSFTVWNDGEITGIAPAKTAGAVNVVVTNATGASTAFAVTYA